MATALRDSGTSKSLPSTELPATETSLEAATVASILPVRSSGAAANLAAEVVRAMNRSGAAGVRLGLELLEDVAERHVEASTLRRRVRRLDALEDARRPELGATARRTVECQTVSVPLRPVGGATVGATLAGGADVGAAGEGCGRAGRRHDGEASDERGDPELVVHLLSLLHFDAVVPAAGSDGRRRPVPPVAAWCAARWQRAFVPARPLASAITRSRPRSPPRFCGRRSVDALTTMWVSSRSCSRPLARRSIAVSRSRTASSPGAPAGGWW